MQRDAGLVSKMHEELALVSRLETTGPIEGIVASQSKDANY